jgi:hypothetical protein
MGSAGLVWIQHGREMEGKYRLWQIVGAGPTYLSLFLAWNGSANKAQNVPCLHQVYHVAISFRCFWPSESAEAPTQL